MIGDVYINPTQVYKWVVIKEFSNNVAIIKDVGGKHILYSVNLNTYIKQEDFIITNRANFENIYEIIGWKHINLNSQSFHKLNEYLPYLKKHSTVNYSDMIPECMQIISPNKETDDLIVKKLKLILNCKFVY